MHQTYRNKHTRPTATTGSMSPTATTGILPVLPCRGRTLARTWQALVTRSTARTSRRTILKCRGRRAACHKGKQACHCHRWRRGPTTRCPRWATRARGQAITPPTAGMEVRITKITGLASNGARRCRYEGSVLLFDLDSGFGSQSWCLALWTDRNCFCLLTTYEFNSFTSCLFPKRDLSQGETNLLSNSTHPCRVHRHRASQRYKKNPRYGAENGDLLFG